jgi:hypothetical protein
MRSSRPCSSFSAPTCGRSTVGSAPWIPKRGIETAKSPAFAAPRASTGGPRRWYTRPQRAGTKLLISREDWSELASPPLAPSAPDLLNKISYSRRVALGSIRNRNVLAAQVRSRRASRYHRKREEKRSLRTKTGQSARAARASTDRARCEMLETRPWTDRCHRRRCSPTC